jgi:hypothetical protein
MMREDAMAGDGRRNRAAGSFLRQSVLRLTFVKRRNLRGCSAADLPPSSFRIDKSVGRCYSDGARLIITNQKREIGLVRATRGLN